MLHRCETIKSLYFQVNIVFHAAATVRFNENLKLAVAINIKGTETVMKMAREMTNLKSFVHVSTAYANCTEQRIKEKIYSPCLEYKKLMAVADSLSEDILEDITPT